jgi:hypothetical protein
MKNLNNVLENVREEPIKKSEIGRNPDRDENDQGREQKRLFSRRPGDLLYFIFCLA